jgi:DNA-directed RNA polymerase subunit D
MQTIKSTPEKIVIKEVVSESLANAIRRFIGEIPILAINEVEIFKNDSALYDETLAHRMGLVPLKMDKHFEKKGKANLKLLSRKEGYIYSGEMKGEADVVYDKIPLLYLNKNQEVEVACYASLGKGKEHAKFSPGFMTYRHVAKFSASKESEDNIKDLPLELADVESVYLSDHFGEVVRKDGKEMRVEPSDEIIITVESFGQLPPKEIILRSIEELKKSLNEVEKSIK